MRAELFRNGLWLAVAWLPVSLLALDDPSHYVKKGNWQETMLASRERLMKQGAQEAQGDPLPNLGQSDFTLSAWIWTQAASGAILAKAPPDGDWAPQGKVLFLRGGALAFDVGWVGAVHSSARVNDGKWHHVVLTGRDPLKFYVDGSLVKSGRLELQADPQEYVAKVGYCASNFPRPSGFKGLIRNIKPPPMAVRIKKVLPPQPEFDLTAEDAEDAQRAFSAGEFLCVPLRPPR